MHPIANAAIKLTSPTLTRSASNLGRKSTHTFNVEKWKLKGKILKFLNMDVPATKKTKVIKHVTHMPNVGDLMIVGNTTKRVIGFNGAHELTNIETKSGELFYGNLYVAMKYAQARTEINGRGYVRAIVGKDLPKDDHHSEAWFPGNWQPLSPEGQRKLEIEAVVLEEHHK